MRRAMHRWSASSNNRKICSRWKRPARTRVFTTCCSGRIAPLEGDRRIRSDARRRWTQRLERRRDPGVDPRHESEPRRRRDQPLSSRICVDSTAIPDVVDDATRARPRGRHADRIREQERPRGCIGRASADVRPVIRRSFGDEGPTGHCMTLCPTRTLDAAFEVHSSPRLLWMTTWFRHRGMSLPARHRHRRLLIAKPLAWLKERCRSHRRSRRLA